MRVKAIAADPRFASTDFTFRVIIEDEEEELGPEWIRAQNVDCHAHRDTIQNLGFWGLATGRTPHTYSGGCLERKTHGHGTAVRLHSGGGAADQRYEGDWKNGRASGLGTRTVGFGGTKTDVYRGNFVNGLMHGQGTHENLEANSRYQGEWRNGFREGQGTFTTDYGYRYVGRWERDRKHGQGIETFPVGNRVEGEWREGHFYTGQGVRVGTDGSRYEGGLYIDYLRHGQGTYTDANGSRYEGEWRFDRFWSGSALDIDEYGNRFEGQYRDGKINGPGTRTYASGGGREGEWRDGEFWNGTETDEFGGVDTYSNGKCIRTISADGTDISIRHDDGSTGSVAKSGWLVTCLRDLERGVEA